MPIYSTNEAVTVTEDGIRICQSSSTRETINITNLGTSRVSIVDTFSKPESQGYPIASDSYVNYSNVQNDAVKHSLIMKSIVGGGNQDVRLQMSYKEEY